MTWDEIIAKGDWVGGDVEVYVDGTIARGRIRKIVREGKVVKVYTSWVAKFDPSCLGKWRKENWPSEVPLGEFSADFFRPEVAEDGSIKLIGPDGRGLPDTLYPKGVNHLDPSLVKGL